VKGTNKVQVLSNIKLNWKLAVALIEDTVKLHSTLYVS